MDTPKSPLKPPPNYASRAVQYRLMVLVATLMLVILLMVEAAKPKNWQWMWKLQPAAAAIDPGDQVANASIAKVDNADDADRELGQDFENHDSKKDLAQPIAKTPKSSHPVDSFISRPVAQQSDADVEIKSDTQELTVNKELLAEIQDNTFFRPEEHAAWFHLLRILRDSNELDAMPATEVGYGQLFRQMDVYRGELVKLEGAVRRAHLVDAPKNSLGIERYWQCFMQLNDGSNSPVIIYALELPPGIPDGMELREPVVLTGFAFKRWSYVAANGPTVAPVVLTRMPVRVAKPTVAAKPPLEKKKFAVAIVVACVLASIVAGLVYLASNWRQTAFQDEERRQVDKFSRLAADAKIPTVLESLKELEATNDQKQS